MINTQRSNYSRNSEQTPKTNSTNTKKEESWLSKNAQLLGGIALGVIAVAVIYKLGQSATTSTNPQEPKWKPLTDADKAPVASFDPVDYVSNPQTSRFNTEITDILLNSPEKKADLTTLFNFCVNNKLTASSDGTAVDLNKTCAEQAFKALPYDHTTCPESGRYPGGVRSGFHEYFPTLCYVDNQWVQRA